MKQTPTARLRSEKQRQRTLLRQGSQTSRIHNNDETNDEMDDFDEQETANSTTNSNNNNNNKTNNNKIKINKNEIDLLSIKNTSNIDTINKIIDYYSFDKETKTKQLKLINLLNNSRNNYYNNYQIKTNQISNVLNNLNKSQIKRLECYNRSHFEFENIKQIMSKTLKISNNKISDKSAIIVSSLAKQLICELTKKSRNIQIEQAIAIKKKLISECKDDNIIDSDNKNENETENEIDSNIDIDIDMDMKKNVNETENDQFKEKQMMQEKLLSNKAIFGPIRPSHIREAYRRMQNDPTNLFSDQPFQSTPLFKRR